MSLLDGTAAADARELARLLSTRPLPADAWQAEQAVHRALELVRAALGDAEDRRPRGRFEALAGERAAQRFARRVWRLP
jgi:hypothetical protein